MVSRRSKRIKLIRIDIIKYLMHYFGVIQAFLPLVVVGDPMFVASELFMHKIKPHTPQQRERAPFSIFVSIASYRDAECSETIRHMYATAAYPDGIHVGAVQQHERSAGDIDCIPAEFRQDECQLSSFCPTDNIKVRYVPPNKARGPTFGRYVSALMYQGEDFFMMIDSHNHFVRNWDTLVVSMYDGLRRDGVAKPVLSQYPDGWWPEKKDQPPLEGRGTASYTCTAGFHNELGIIKLDGFITSKGKKPRPQAWAAAGFLFANGTIVSEVPFDPYLYYVFDGEEVLYSVRLWTHGYDMYSPHENILFHHYGRHNSPRYWSHVIPAKKRSAEKRIQRFLQAVKRNTQTRLVPDDDPDTIVHIEEEKYGLGTSRSLDEWYHFSGVDKVNYRVACKFCTYQAQFLSAEEKKLACPP